MRMYIYMVLLALVLPVSCKRLQEAEAPVPMEGVTYILRAGVSEKTRASISDEGEFSWSSGDRVSVLDGNSGDLCIFTCEDGDGQFSFTGEPGREYNFTKAWYPASMVKSEGVLTFPSEWDYSSVCEARQFPMEAVVDGENMMFYHLSGIIRVTVNNVPKDATALILSSDEVALSGDFGVSDLTLDQGRGDADGESVTIEDGTVPYTKSVSEIESGSGASGITVNLSLPSLGTARVYLPIPCGTYNYKVTVKVGDEIILERATSIAKDIDRASLIRMSALNVAWPATALQASYASTDVAFGPSDLWGWYVARSLPAGQDISVTDTGTSTSYGAKHSTKKKAGYFVECLSGANARVFPLQQESDLYISADRSKLFPLESGSAAVLPTEYEVAHFGLRGNFGTGSYVSKGTFVKTTDKAPAGGWGWYVVRSVACTSDEIEFKLYSNMPTVADGLVVAGTATRQNAGIGRTLTWTQDGQYPIFYRVTSGMSYDVYLREDLGQVIVYESGSQGSMDEERIKSLVNYGLYSYGNASWVYNPGMDQTWVITSSTTTFVIADGVTFDQIQISGLPTDPEVGDVVSVGVTVTPGIGVEKSSAVTTTVVKKEGDKVWLLDSLSGTGIIVSVQ